MYARIHMLMGGGQILLVYRTFLIGGQTTFTRHAEQISSIPTP